MRIPLGVALVAFPVLLGAQEQAATPAGPPLAAFAAERVAILPLQYWRADTIGWSAAIPAARIRPQVDSAIAEALRDRGMGTRWSYAADAIRGARRNPIYSSDPTSLGVGRWRSTPPAVGDPLPALVADNLRMVTALGDTRYALVPVELRADGGAAVLRLVLADTRLRTVTWLGDVAVLAPDGLLSALGARVADLVLDP